MSCKRIIFLAVILFAVAGYYFLFESDATEEKKGEREALKMALNFKEADVEEIKLVRKESAILLKREKGGWSIVEPIRSKADGRAVSVYLGNLAEVVEVRLIEGSPSDLSIFGLKSPAMEVVLKQKNNAGLISLLLGYDNPNHTCVYAKMKNSPKIFLIGSLYKIELDVGVEYFKTKEKASPWL